MGVSPAADRSPHTSPSAVRGEGRVSAAVYLLEESMKEMAGRHAAELQSMKEANLMLRRDLFSVRDDLRAQAAAALAQAHAALRHELSQLAAERFKDLESKAHTFEIETFGRIKILNDELEKAAAANVSMVGRTTNLEDRVKAHEVYIQASHDSKPEDALGFLTNHARHVPA